MNEEVTFSVCIPNFNYAEYIGRTIQSVLNQTYQNFEIIVADNASTDDSVKVIESFQDSRIRLLRNSINIGFSPNLDRATRYAKGDFIILLSSDDIMRKEALLNYSEIIKREEQKSNLVVMSACDIIDARDQVVGAKSAMTGDILSAANLRQLPTHDSQTIKLEALDILKSLLTRRFQPAGQFLTTCISRELFNSVEGYSSILSIWPDAHLSHKLLFRNPSVIYLEKRLFAYRVHGNNNLAATESMSNIKALVDGYHLTLLYSSDDLQRIGLIREDLVKAFVRFICLEPAFWSVLRGNLKLPYHHVMFAFSSYPGKALLEYRTYCIILLLPLFPLLSVMNKIFRVLRK